MDNREMGHGVTGQGRACMMGWGEVWMMVQDKLGEKWCETIR